MKHNRVSELSEAGQEKLVKELVARVWLAERTRQYFQRTQVQWGPVVEAAVFDAALAGFAFTIEEVALEELAARAEAKATVREAERPQPPPPASTTAPEDESGVAQDVHDLAAALDGKRRVWVKPGHFARALEPKLEGLGLQRIRDGLYVGGYSATVTEEEALKLMAALRALRVGYEQEAVPSEGAP